MLKTLAAVLVFLTPLAAQPAVTAVVNAASFAPAPLAPGSLATAFGTFPISAPISATSVPLPLSLGGLSLQFGNGQQAPLFFAAPNQVNFQIPWELAGPTQTTVTASFSGQTSQTQELTLAPFAPAIFSLSEQGTGQGLIVDPSYRLVDSNNPATPGSTIVQIYATGLGAVTNPPATGSPAPSSPLSQTPTTPVVTIGGAAATVLFSGLEPGQIGVYQINAVVPAGASGGSSVPVTLSIGGATSNTVTIAVNGTPPPNPTPMITALSPSAASPGTAVALTVTGAGFTSASSLTFNGVSHSATYVSATQLSVSLTSADLASAGSFPISITNPAPGGGTSNSVSFLAETGFGTGASASIAWSGVARNGQHTALSPVQSQPLNRIHWSTAVDLQPQYTESELLIHYGAPSITSQNTVIVPVKTGATNGFRVEAHSGTDGTLLWTASSDYVLPPHDWVPEFAPALTPTSRVYFPGAGGTVYYRDSPDSATGAQGQLAFYGLSTYQADPQAYASNVMISTPITSDSGGNIYFGFQVIGSTPAGLASGIARISAGGQGTWISAAAAASDNAIIEVPLNCAPALNETAGLLYIAVSNGTAGYLLALNSTTLQTVARTRLLDPVSGLNGMLSDDGSASPTVGPDGDVYYGVLENPQGSNHYRGWLLHFDSRLAQSKTTGAFGWDDTASVVPSFMVASYSGSSSYLVMTKYNDYASVGGTGQNRIAVLDPNATEKDPVTGASVMKEAVTILSPTPATTGFKEWCINSAAVDPATRSILVNNEDGNLYRWNLSTNTLSQRINLTSGLGEAYTPTLIGSDGTVYAISNAMLFAVGQ